MADVEAVTLEHSAPVLVVDSVADSVAYYRDVLSFDVAFVYGQPAFYAGVCRGHVTIHLQAAAETKRQPGHGAINIFVNDVDRLHDEFKARGARIVKPPADYSYGMRDFDLLDPDGNQLCFGMESRPKA